MKNNLFMLEENRLKEEILKRGAKKVLLQLPDGLKPEGPRLAKVIEDVGATAIISGEPCYGACDLPIFEAEILAADLILHYGHTKIMADEKTPVPIVYIEAKVDIDVREAVEKSIEQLEKWSKIGLTTTVQHVHKLDEAKRILNKSGKTVYIGDAGHTKYPGQVLGCDYSNAKSVADKVEAFLFVGGGRFHALGLYLATMKPTIVADPFEKKAYPVEADAQKIIRRRWASIDEAKEAKNFGVLIGLKPGQNNIEAALEIKQSLEKNGKKAVLLTMREITPMTLMQFSNIEAYVNTACIRISYNEPASFVKPVLTPKEVYVMLGRMKWEDLLKEGIV